MVRMDQEVLVKLKRTEQDKRIAQNKRLLQEFPWLWAIRNSWYLGWNKIIVKAGDDDDLQSLRSMLVRNPNASAEYWICKANCPNSTSIQRVTIFEPKSSISENIRLALQADGFMLTHIITIVPIAGEGRDSFTIYRARKKSLGDLHNMIFSLASTGGKE